MTLRGITVLAPLPLNAPSMPVRQGEREKKRLLMLHLLSMVSPWWGTADTELRSPLLRIHSYKSYRLVPRVSKNWPHFVSPCFSLLIAHWFRDTVQTLFTLLYLPQLNCSWLLDWTSENLPANPSTQLILWYFHSLSSLCMHALTWHHLSGTLSLMKSGLQHPLTLQIIS